MSKSTSDSLFCLEGLWLDRVEQLDEIINLHVRKTNKTDVCLACGRKTSRVHKKGRRTVKHMRLNDMLVLFNGLFGLFLSFSYWSIKFPTR